MAHREGSRCSISETGRASDGGTTRPPIKDASKTWIAAAETPTYTYSRQTFPALDKIAMNSRARGRPRQPPVSTTFGLSSPHFGMGPLCHTMSNVNAAASFTACMIYHQTTRITITMDTPHKENGIRKRSTNAYVCYNAVC